METRAWNQQQEPGPGSRSLVTDAFTDLLSVGQLCVGGQTCSLSFTPALSCTEVQLVLALR